MYLFKIYDMDGNLHYELKFTPSDAQPFQTVVGDEHSWVWDPFEGCLRKDGSTDILYGGSWSITIEKAEV